VHSVQEGSQAVHCLHGCGVEKQLLQRLPLCWPRGKASLSSACPGLLPPNMYSLRTLAMACCCLGFKHLTRPLVQVAASAGLSTSLLELCINHHGATAYEVLKMVSGAGFAAVWMVPVFLITFPGQWLIASCACPCSAPSPLRFGCTGPNWSAPIAATCRPTACPPAPCSCDYLLLVRLSPSCERGCVPSTSMLMRTTAAKPAT